MGRKHNIIINNNGGQPSPSSGMSGEKELTHIEDRIYHKYADRFPKGKKINSMKSSRLLSNYFRAENVIVNP
jgi:hypothetical protein